VSLVLALTFGFYGLIRKQAPVKALPGLVVETWMLVPIAIAWLLFNQTATSAQPEFWTTSEAWWLVAAGPVTLVPLVCFNAAARHLPYTTLGFLQYLAPTLVLLQAVLLFGEKMSPSTLVAFIFIWAGLALYSVDAVISLRRRS
jgi:chloramphenicol-sensitive protein RarD